ncbi:MAG TPA: hypothetical protein VM163_10825 [bacterium]|nr:hypothetical protein [bacterium]
MNVAAASLYPRFFVVLRVLRGSPPFLVVLRVLGGLPLPTDGDIDRLAF